jgi:uncharacterized membrane protein YvbJ
MAYCQACGTQNEDDAAFCKKCGHDLRAATGGPAHGRPPDEELKDDCERDCYGTTSGKSMFWGIIIVLVGIWIIFEFVIKEIVDVPKWMRDFEFCWVAWIIIGIAIVAAGMRAMMRGSRQG